MHCFPGRPPGDVEVLLEMETYMQTAICTQRTEVLLLEMKHFERLLVKRNPRTIDNMKGGLELKLTSRISNQVAHQVPLLKVLSNKVEEYLEQRQQANEARAKARETKNNNKAPGKKGAVAAGGGATGKVPPMELSGPGAAFQRIRQRQHAKAKQNVRNTANNAAGNDVSVASGSGAAATGTGSAFPGSPMVSRVNAGDATSISPREVNPEMIDPELDQLEDRMRDWLVNEKGARGRVQQKYQVRRAAKASRVYI